MNHKTQNPVYIMNDYAESTTKLLEATQEVRCLISDFRELPFPSTSSASTSDVRRRIAAQHLEKASEALNKLEDLARRLAKEGQGEKSSATTDKETVRHSVIIAA